MTLNLKMNLFLMLFFFFYSLQTDRNTFPKKGLEYVITVTAHNCLKASYGGASFVLQITSVFFYDMA